jgi:hypothetical protein
MTVKPFILLILKKRVSVSSKGVYNTTQNCSYIYSIYVVSWYMAQILLISSNFLWISYIFCVSTTEYCYVCCMIFSLKYSWPWVIWLWIIKLWINSGSKQAVWSSNTSDLYSGGARCGSWPWHQLPWPFFFLLIFLSPSMKMSE